MNALCGIAAICVVFLLGSCDKHDSSSERNSPSNSNPLLHKWNVVTHIDTFYHFQGPVDYLNYQGTGNDYLNFVPETGAWISWYGGSPSWPAGTLYIFEDGRTDTLDFAAPGQDSLIFRRKYPRVMPFEWLKIELLTEDSLQLSGPRARISNSHDYGMIHYYLNR